MSLELSTLCPGLFWDLAGLMAEVCGSKSEQRELLHVCLETSATPRTASCPLTHNR